MFSCNADIHSESPSHRRSITLRDAAFLKHVLLFFKIPLEEKENCLSPAGTINSMDVFLAVKTPRQTSSRSITFLFDPTD